eukprot:756439-Pelagomonas_calceolata.AAC.3
MAVPRGEECVHQQGRLQQRWWLPAEPEGHVQLAAGWLDNESNAGAGETGSSDTAVPQSCKRGDVAWERVRSSNTKSLQQFVATIRMQGQAELEAVSQL